jgi:hypothetical protein
MRNPRRAIRTACRFVCLSVLPVAVYLISAGYAVAFAPQNGHWWNPNE